MNKKEAFRVAKATFVGNPVTRVQSFSADRGLLMVIGHDCPVTVVVYGDDLLKLKGLIEIALAHKPEKP